MKHYCPKCKDSFDKDHDLVDHLVKKHPEYLRMLRQRRGR